MSRFSLEAKVGIFFLACLAIFAYVWFKVLQVDWEKGFVLKAYFKSVEGLVEGSQVQIAGIKVGKVKSITFDQARGNALVVLEIRSDYKDSISEDSRVLVRTKGLLGDKYIIIQTGKPNASKLRSGEEIKQVYEPADTEKLLETMGLAAQDLQILTREARIQIVDQQGAKKVDGIITNANKIFKDVGDLVSGNKDKMDSSIKKVDSVVAVLDQVRSKNKDKIDRTLDNVDKATRGANEIITRNKGKVDRSMDGIENVSMNLDKTAGEFTKLASDLRSLTNDVQNGRGTLGKLVADESLYQKVDSIAQNLQGITNQVRSGGGTVSRLINDPEMYYEARRAVRNMNKTAEDVSEATPVSTLAIIVGSVFK
ncbi:MAG: MlaD family protein [Pseudomonadota bacterium]